MSEELTICASKALSIVNVKGISRPMRVRQTDGPPAPRKVPRQLGKISQCEARLAIHDATIHGPSGTVAFERPNYSSADRGWSKCRTSGIVIAILALYHENRYLERKWYSRPASSVLRMGGARPPRRGMPAGVESGAGTDSQPMPPYRLPRLLARTARLFRGIAPRQEGNVRTRTGIQSSRLRHGIPHRSGNNGQAGACVRVRAKRRQRLPGQTRVHDP